MKHNRHLLTNLRPASTCYEKWKEGTPLGNGEMGALVEGGILEENITLTRHDLWNWRITETLPDVHETLQQARDAMDRGDYAYANGLLSKTLHEQGYGNKLSSPFPLGTLKIRIGTEAVFYHYRRLLDMEHGISHIQYEQGNANTRSRTTREAFVSASDNVTVFHLENPDGIDTVTISLDLKECSHKENAWMREELAQTRECYVKDGLLYFGYQFDNGKQTGAVVKVCTADGQIVYDEKMITVQNSTAFTILVKSFTGVKEDFLRTAEALLLLSCSYEDLKQRHAEKFASIYNSCQVQLADENSPGFALSNEDLIQQGYDDTMSPEFTEKFWNFGRYLFLSATSPSTNPMPLYGLWACDYGLPWPQHVANENVQLIYWHVNTGGLADYARSLIHYYYKKIPQMQENAQKLFGCRGIFLSTYSSPIDGLVAPVVPVITNWISGAGWMCQHFYNYYRYTKDETLLLEEILPFMVETAAFYEDYICYDENGSMKIYPSVSPENSPGNFERKDGLALTHAMPAVKNATMDFAVMKEMLTNLLKICKERDLYPEKTACWQHLLDTIPPYMINEDGAVKEWMSNDLEEYYHHRHLSHIYPVFPGDEITKASDANLYKAFEKALELRELGAQCGWAMVHMAAIYSRFGRSEDAVHCLDMLPKSVILPNFLTMGIDYRSMGITFEEAPWMPVQLDVNMGYVNAVQEMLFRYQNETIYLLPACPKRWNQGNVKGFCFPGGQANFSWNLEKDELHAVISTEDGTQPKVILPQNLKNAKILFERTSKC